MMELDERPSISISDFKLRLFIDTNVLIDFLEKSDSAVASFLNFFKHAIVPLNIAVSTSDYVTWELQGYFKEDLYIRKMIMDPTRNHGYKRAHRDAQSFKEATDEEMKNIGDKLTEMMESIDFIHTERYMGKEAIGFCDSVEHFLKYSKFQYKDIMVLVSAIHSNSHAHMLVTRDEQFSKEGSRIERLKQLMQTLPKTFLQNTSPLEFRRPEDLESKDKIADNYRCWFEKNTRGKEIGKVTDHWPLTNSVGIQCHKDYNIGANDWIYIVKFGVNWDLSVTPTPLKIESDNILDYDSEKAVTAGGKVTIKFSKGLPQGVNLQNACVFLSNDL